MNLSGDARVVVVALLAFAVVAYVQRNVTGPLPVIGPYLPQ